MKKYLTVFFDRKNDIIVDNCTGLKNKSDFWLWHVFSNISVDIFCQKVYFPQLLYVFIPNFLVPVPPPSHYKNKTILVKLPKLAFWGPYRKYIPTHQRQYISKYMYYWCKTYFGEILNVENWKRFNLKIVNISQFPAIRDEKKYSILRSLYL